MNRIRGKAWKQWYKLTLYIVIYRDRQFKPEAVERFQTSFHVLYPAFHVFSSRKNVFFTFLPGKTITNVDCIDQEVEWELARKGFALLINRKTQPFPPLSMFWR